MVSHLDAASAVAMYGLNDFAESMDLMRVRGLTSDLSIPRITL